MKQSDREKVALLYWFRRRKKLYKRKYWVHPLNERRVTLGEHIKIEEMYLKYPLKFFEYTRLLPSQFDTVLRLIEPHIRKEETNYRQSIIPKHRLFVTLRYLTTGDSMKTIATSYSMGKSTVQTIIWETCKAIWDALSPIYMKLPDESEWRKIIDEYFRLWNFPNCLGAIDGKHVMIQAPVNSGSLYYNYKGFFSLVLLATCDAQYRFTTVDIGAYGRQSDGGILSNSRLGKKLIKGSLPVPGDLNLPGTMTSQPCTFVGDDAFALSSFMMRPYPGKQTIVNKKRIFNYRLSRARRIIENVFGILSSRFRIYKRCIQAQAQNAELIVKATTVLHNFLRTEEIDMKPESRVYCPNGYADYNDENNGAWRQEGRPGGLSDITSMGSNNYTKTAKDMRENIAEYFVKEGSVPWQNERAAVFHDSDPE